MAEKKIQTDATEDINTLFGPLDETVKIIEKRFSVVCVNRENENGGCITVSGEDAESVELAARALKVLMRTAKLQGALSPQTVEYVTDTVAEGKDDELLGYDEDCVCVTVKGKPIKPKTAGQQKYVRQIKKNTIVFGIGPAGTGKTFLAVAMAVTALRSKEISRIVLTRPAVEAGEKLGFLPGDLQNKIDPYLRPLYDALFETLGPEVYARHLERGTIEIAPLAYMRGRTLDDAFIILDEAQNTTREQMKMLLTRLGMRSKIVITGDVTQIDLPRGTGSGLIEASEILQNIDGIAVHRFTEKDVVRHRLVKEIIAAYEKKDEKREEKKKKEGEVKADE